MRLLEYRAKEILSRVGVAVPEGMVITSTDALDKVPARLGRGPYVVKVQIPAGGRGKAGGVRICDGPGQLREAVVELLGKSFTASQAGGPRVVDKLLVEKKIDHGREYYLAVVLDRSARAPVIVFSTRGGMEIEESAREDPGAVTTLRIDPISGYRRHALSELLWDRLENQADIVSLGRLADLCCKLFLDNDALLVEINPLVLAGEGNWMALDAKIEIDDSALYRQPLLARQRLSSLPDVLERKAARADVNYIRLEGEIGCLVNGAGLAMATMDTILEAGGRPANFLDIGGGVDAEGVKKALNILFNDPGVRGIFINIFGGIVRCDTVAEALSEVLPKIKRSLPTVVRLEGTNREEALEILQESNSGLVIAGSMMEGAEKIVSMMEIS